MSDPRPTDSTRAVHGLMRVELGLVVLFLAVLSQAQNATNATVSPVLNGVDVVAYFNLTDNTAGPLP